MPDSLIDSGFLPENRDDAEVLAILMETVPLSIVISTFAEGRILLANRAFQQNTGFSADELNAPDKTDAKLYFDPEDQKCFREALRKTGRVDGFSIRLRDKDLHRYNVQLSGRRIRYRNQDCILSVSTSFIPIKVADDALRESEKRYQGILQRIAEGYFEVDLSGRIFFCNDALSRITGYSAEELKGMSYKEFTSRDREKYLFRSFHEVYRTKAEKTLNFEIIQKEGSRIHVETSIGPLPGDAGLPFGFYGVMRDRTKQRKVEDQLRQSERNYRTLLEMAPDVITISRLSDSRYLHVNKVFCEKTGFSADEAIGKNPSELGLFVDSEERKALVETLRRKGKVIGRELVFRSREGAIHHHLLSSQAIRFQGEDCLLSISKDISRQKKLEAQLLQAQKMEAIGTLAGGVAHDFNNLLMGIQGNISLATTEIDAGHPLNKRLKSIGQYVNAGADLTRQLLGTAKGGKVETKATDLNRLLESSSRLFGRTRKEIRIHKKLEKRLWTVEVDRGQIQQVLLNLYVNAWQAMPQGGDLYLESRNVVLDVDAVKPTGTRPGNFARISITDTGIGIDKETLKRIFEPFFTTREMGKGTGLGLASAYGIIANHGGIINAYSEKGQGTTFTMYLPASSKPVETDINDTETDAVQGTETLLFVDDDAGIIEIGKMMLEKLGYTVITAQDGTEALEIYRRRHKEFDLVLLDMIMPEISGGETFNALKKINPDVKVLLSSGYSINGRAQEILDRGCMGFIQKPFGLKDLSVKLRQVLSSPESSD